MSAEKIKGRVLTTKQKHSRLIFRLSFMRTLQNNLDEGKWDEIRDQLKSARGQAHIRQRLFNDATSQQHVTALHLACRQRAPIDIIQSILSISQVLSLTLTKEGQDLPLHFAVASNRLNTVAYLLHMNPISGGIRSGPKGVFGNQVTPLHVAVTHQVDVEIIALLLNACPSSRSLRNTRGETALQLALSNYSGVDRNKVINLLQPPLKYWDVSAKVVPLSIGAVLAIQVMVRCIWKLMYLEYLLVPLLKVGVAFLQPKGILLNQVRSSRALGSTGSLANSSLSSDSENENYLSEISH